MGGSSHGCSPLPGAYPTHSLTFLCQERPPQPPLTNLGGRWDWGYGRVRYKGRGACSGHLTCWGSGKALGSEILVELRIRSRCPLGMWEREGLPAGRHRVG